MMRVDMRVHPQIREQVHAGLSALRVQARQVWGTQGHDVTVLLRFMTNVRDLARLMRTTDGVDERMRCLRSEIKKELGNLIFSTIRWIDDLDFDVLECLDLAIEAQERFAKSGRQR